MNVELFQHTSAVAIRAALFLALQPPGKLSTVQEIAAGTGLPKSYLAKIVHQLASAGLVRSFRGPGGGFELGRAPEAISLSAVVRAMEGPYEPEDCVLGSQWCSSANPCPLDLQWGLLRDKAEKLLDQTTLATLVGTLREREKTAERGMSRAGAAHTRGNSAEGDRRHAS